jgi:hypothetical protein
VGAAALDTCSFCPRDLPGSVYVIIIFTSRRCIMRVSQCYIRLFKYYINISPWDFFTIQTALGFLLIMYVCSTGQVTTSLKTAEIPSAVSGSGFFRQRDDRNTPWGYIKKLNELNRFAFSSEKCIHRE